MKSISILVSLIVTIFLLTFIVLDQWGTEINGEGPVVTQTLSVDPFTGINLSIPVNIMLTQGTRQQVKIKGQQNLIDNINLEVQRDSWSITSKSRNYNYDDITIFITIPKLESIAIEGSGDINSTNQFQTVGDIDISITGSGNASLMLQAERTSINITGSGKVSLLGNGENLEVKITGSGDVRSLGFSVKKSKIRITGSGSVEVNVSEKLKAFIVGSGQIKYKGMAELQASINGSGTIEKSN